MGWGQTAVILIRAPVTQRTLSVHERIRTEQVWSVSFVFQHLERYVIDARLKITAVYPFTLFYQNSAINIITTLNSTIYGSVLKFEPSPSFIGNVYHRTFNKLWLKYCTIMHISSPFMRKLIFIKYIYRSPDFWDLTSSTCCVQNILNSINAQICLNLWVVLFKVF